MTEVNLPRPRTLRFYLSVTEGYSTLYLQVLEREPSEPGLDVKYVDSRFIVSGYVESALENAKNNGLNLEGLTLDDLKDVVRDIGVEISSGHKDSAYVVLNPERLVKHLNSVNI